MKFEIITSFNESYYNNIGKDCVGTWLKYWPKNMNLTCYVEDFAIENHARINQISFDNLSNEYRNFQLSSENERVKIFAKKAYSVIHAFENSDADRIMWIDADVLTTNKVPLSFLESLCPDSTLATFMGVWHHADKQDAASKLFFSAETGVFVVNKNHKNFKEFSARYRQYYDEHIRENIRRFYDGEVFGAVAKEFENIATLNDLCGDFIKNYKTPMKHTALGKYFVHYKSKHSKIDYLDNQ